MIIPVRNEEENLKVLLQELNSNSVKREQVLFVNDHSEDGSKQLIEEFGFEVIDLEEDEKGKKEALIKGAKRSNKDFLLFNDADVLHPKTYYKILNEVPYMGDFDICILPVEIADKKGLWNRFVQLDFDFLQFLTFSFRGNLGNGANLLVKKSVFESLSDGLETELLSGDDYFLIRECRRRKGKIKYQLSKELSVKTEAPLNFNSLLDQRSRWIQKSFRKGSLIENTLSFLWIALSFTPYLLLISIVLSQDENYLFILFIKLMIDIMLFIPVLYFNKRLRLLSLLPLLQFLYPIYYISVLIRTGKRNKWKDRDL